MNSRLDIPHRWLARFGHSLSAVAIVAIAGCGGGPTPLVVGGAPVADGYVLESPRVLRGGDDLRRVAPTIASDEAIYVVVEIPAGTTAKWQVRHRDGALEWEERDGAPRVVDYLPYPANYGMVPSTVLSTDAEGDGDPLDALLLGDPLPRGAVVRARPVAVLRMRDRGERDDKILAVPLEGPFAKVDSLAALDRHYPGITLIIELWFTHYDRRDRPEILGWLDAAAAWHTIAAARQ